MYKILLSIIIILLLAACQSATPAPVLPTETIPPPTATTAPATPTVEEAPQIAPTEEMSAAVSASTILFQVIPEQSRVVYEVGEVFFNQGNRFAVAVGVTNQVSGEIVVAVDHPQNSTLGVFQVDISQFTSDSSRRDNAIRQRYLESESYPIATFEPLEYSDLPESYTPGEEITFSVTGNLTIRQKTLPATFEVTLIAQPDQITGEAVTTFTMSSYEFGPINIAGILKTEDEVRVIFTFVAEPVQ